MTDKRYSWLSGWRLVFLIYVGLLLLSHLWRAYKPDRLDIEPGQQAVSLYQVQDGRILENKTLKVAYYDKYQGNQENPPVILLLPGSPVGIPFISEIIDDLTIQNRVIAPDFPGYDASDREIPDYSMKSFSVYMNQLMDSLQVDSAHIVGYSLGAGVAVNIAHRFPSKVQSIDMLSGLGVQELELLGSYHLNHAIYGGQLFLVWLLHEGIPHFGLLHDFPIHVPYARTFYDSDQRPIRNYLKKYKKPMLIQHGRKDGLVPLAAAREHHRLVPQSKLILYDGGHAIIKSRSKVLSSDINSFLRDVENGQAMTYAEAPKERKIESQKPFKDIDFAKAEGITLFILVLIIIFSSFISEDMACIGAGLLAARGIIGLWTAIFASFMGIIIGDFTIFLMGRWLGEPAVRRAPFRWFVSKKDLERSADWFKVRGPMIIIGSRFVPGSRFPTYFSAGMIGMSMPMFSAYFLLAGAVWTPLLVGLSMLVGTELLRYFQVYQAYALWVVPVIIFLLLLFVKFIMPAVTWRGRRMVVSRWNRLTQWEYWPPSVIYTPIVMYIIYLGIKYGKLTSFTAANPGIPHGGFIGESKEDIYEKMWSSGAIAKYLKIPCTQNSWHKFVMAREFIKNQNIKYPVTVKPDAGQRGEGVEFPRNEQELQEALSRKEYDCIIQEYVEGEEYGIFYYRYPGREKGKILSITAKQLPTIKGDGELTLEELILQDERAVSLAKMHFREHQENLFDIPEKGKEIQLVNLGTHSRGAQFFDASHLITENLRETMDELVSHFDGFYFGRLDIRVPSEDDLKEGNCIKILEINGVTSETTIIYDTKYSFFDAQKMLRNQWRIAFGIGNENLKRGYTSSSVIDLLRSIIEYRNR